MLVAIRCVRLEARQPGRESHSAGLPIFVQGEQRRVGVGVKQAPPLVAVQLRGLVRDMRRRPRMLPTAAERIAMIRDVVIFCVAFHTMVHGLELSVAVASQVLQMTGGEGFISTSYWGRRYELVPSGCGKEEPRLPRNLRGRSRGRAPTGGEIHAIVTRRGVIALVPERSRRRGEGGTGVDAGADNHRPPDPSAGGWHGG